MNLYLSLIRTGIPALVGWLVALAASHGLGLDGEALSGVLTPLAAFCYYAVFRLAEHYVSPKFGWLLGYARPPQYPYALAA
ncbi:MULTISPECIES: hypothetical protein [unclassified Streptomyces]|uniref:hypothetical protein n=1 Tax=unclassified Streptomyces TaxID=2593676 RepID=UPI002E80B92B|nr:hypothetical protein [Streptomyces sp. NBC_00589]WTI37432.1 hypothetical protein OIC96_21650 [Streptomyces sp. NBC_00775]WUB28891.1 hypothetical protein OHA51_28085 [Streptomyces sp. NBC_00589]